MMPLADTQVPPAKKKAPEIMEIFLASLTVPVKAKLASKGLEAPEAASNQPVHGPPKDKIVMKWK